MSTKNATLCDTDFHAWANEQAALPRAGRLSEADIENIAKEIESIARSEKRELVNRLTALLLHLLKWRYQPGLRGRSLQLTIEQRRMKVGDHPSENPSLKSQLDDITEKAYNYSRFEAEHETHLPRQTFPAFTPFPFDKAMNPGFWPD